jgi:hypothetical protein
MEREMAKFKENFTSNFKADTSMMQGEMSTVREKSFRDIN